MRKMMVKRNDLEKAFEQGKFDKLVKGFVKVNQGQSQVDKKQTY